MVVQFVTGSGSLSASSNPTEGDKTIWLLDMVVYVLAYNPNGDTAGTQKNIESKLQFFPFQAGRVFILDLVQYCDRAVKREDVKSPV